MPSDRWLVSEECRENNNNNLLEMNMIIIKEEEKYYIISLVGMDFCRDESSVR